jgi:hypothetical protein
MPYIPTDTFCILSIAVRWVPIGQFGTLTRGEFVTPRAYLMENQMKHWLWQGMLVTAIALSTAGSMTRAATIVGTGGNCLDVQFNGTADETTVWMFPCNGTTAQQWSVVDGQFVGTGSNKCLDVKFGGTAPETLVWLFHCNGTAAQKWSVANGEIRGIGGNCLDVKFGGTAPETPVWMFPCNGTAAQKWSIR